MTAYSLTHLRQLEAESIHIIREVAAEFDNPVMLYSIGKDFSRYGSDWLRRRFYPAKPPFPPYACRHHLEIPGDVSVTG